MDKLDIVMLGRPQVRWQGAKVVFPFAKAEALLYYMLIKEHTTRSELAGLFWSERDDLTAKKNLRNTLYWLKKLIPCNLLIRPSRSVIALNTQEVAIACDAAHFAQGGQNVVSLWQGEFLEGFICKDAPLFEAWLDGQRERWRSLYVKLLTSSVVGLLNAKDFEQSKQYLERLIMVDEYNESAYRALMSIYEKHGDRNKVIEVYQKLKYKLHNDLGLEVNTKTLRIYDRAVKCKPPVPAQAQAVGRNMFFGRTRELAQLQKWFGVFQEGCLRTQTIVVTGEQGVGKSAIVVQLVKMLSGSQLTVLQGQAYQAELNYPYKVWSNIFGQVVECLEAAEIEIPSVWRQVIAYVFPALASAKLAVQDFSILKPVLQPTMVENVMVGLLSKLVKLQKIVLIIDDMQWLDNPSLSVLKHFLQKYGDDVLVIAICRSECLDKFDWMMRDREQRKATKLLVVKNFSYHDTAAFAALVLGDQLSDAALLDKLYAYTQGNALFLAECFRLIQAGHAVDQLSGRLQAVIKERLSELSDKARLVLDISAAFCKEARYDEIVVVYGGNEFELVEAIEELQSKRLLIAVKHPKGRPVIYKICHGLIKDFVYARMSSSRQQVIHHKIGCYLETLINGDVRSQGLYFAVRHHYLLAGQRIKALEYTIKFAEKYLFPYYEMYPALSDGLLEETDTQIQLSLDQQLAQIETSLAVLQEEAGVTSFSSSQAAYLEMLGRYYIWRGEHRSGLKVIHRLLRLAAAYNYHDYELRGYQQIVYCGIQMRRAKVIQRFADKLFAKAAIVSSTEKMAVAMRYKGLAEADRDEALAECYYRKSIRMFRKIALGCGKYDAQVAAAYNYIADLRSRSGKLAEALFYYEKANQFYQHHSVGEGVVIVCIKAGYSAFQLRKYDKARAYLTNALRLQAKREVPCGCWSLQYFCTLYSILTLLALQEKRLSETLVYMKKADELLNTYHDKYQLGVALCVKAVVASFRARNKNAKCMFDRYLPFSANAYLRKGQQVFFELARTREFQVLINALFKSIETMSCDQTGENCL